MKTFVRVCISAFVSALVSIPSGKAQTNIYPGEVEGKWKLKHSPYYVLGEITVADKKQLKIEPGVQVIFKGHYKFNVRGSLLAIGTEQELILFTAENTEVGWHGIRFMETPSKNDTSKLIYCRLTYGKANTGSGYDRCGGAMLIHSFDKVLVSHCQFEFNEQSGDGWEPIIEAAPAIYIYNASPLIINSTFKNHIGSKGSAISCLASPRPIIANNVFEGNAGGLVGPIVTRDPGSALISGNRFYGNYCYYAAGGIAVEMSSTPRIENNVIFNNYAPYGGGIVCWIDAGPVVINNTIVYNYTYWEEGGGVICVYNSDAVFINNIIYGNWAWSSSSPDQVGILDLDSDPHFMYCDIQGGIEGFTGYGAGPNYTGIFQDNIDTDPLLDFSTFSLSDISPCIGAGIGSLQFGSQWYVAPAFDMYGSPRPFPSGTIPDIGAVENHLGAPLALPLPKPGVTELRPTEYALHQNYPNPFNPSTTIKFELPTSSEVRLSVFDMLGREVSVLVNERRDAGVHEVKFDAASLASGVYLYRLQAGDLVHAKRLVVLK